MNIQELIEALPFGGIVSNPTVPKLIKLTKGDNGSLLMGSGIAFDKCVIPHEEGQWEICIEFLDFSKALHELKNGRAVYRDDWNGSDQFVYMMSGGEIASHLRYGFDEYVGEPIFNSMFVLKNSKNELSSWVPSIGDLLSTSWIVK